MLDGEDQDAFIADANFERRDLTNLSLSHISRARTVLHDCPQFVDLLIDGSMGLDVACAEAGRLGGDSHYR
jgi:exoribonuclease II